MSVSRGDVVLLDYPYSSGGGTKLRPALVVQNDRDNQRLTNTIVVQITSATRRALELTQVLVELNSAAGKQSGLRQDSVVNCVNLLTLDQTKIIRKIGTLPRDFLLQVDHALVQALGLTPIQNSGVRVGSESWVIHEPLQ
jgi:mRNA interferase MazF